MEMNRNRLMFLTVLMLCVGVNLRAQQQYTIATCAEPFRPKDYVGGRFKLLIPKNVTVRRGKDIDYSEYSVGYSVRKKTYWLSGIFGPMATSGNVPKDLL